MKDYKLQLSDSNIQEVESDNDNNLVELLQQEIKKLCSPYNAIARHNGKYVYYKHSDLDEEYGEEVDPDTLENYNAIIKVITYLWGKNLAKYI